MTIVKNLLNNSKPDLLFVHIPRTGGTYIENKLGTEWNRECLNPNSKINRQKLFGFGKLESPVPHHNQELNGLYMLQHLTLEQMEYFDFLPKKLDEYHKVAITRNPYTRALSLYKYHLKENMRQMSFLNFLLEIKSVMKAHNVNLSNIQSFTLTRHNFDTKSYFERYLYHMIPQVAYTHNHQEKCMTDQLIRYEDEFETFTTLLKERGHNIDVEFEGNPNVGQFMSKNREYFTPTTIKLINELYQLDFKMLGYIPIPKSLFTSLDTFASNPDTMTTPQNTVVLTQRQQCDLELILNGGFAPLKGFLNEDDYNSVVSRMRLTSDKLWPMPITLPLNLNDKAYTNTSVHDTLILTDEENYPLATLYVESLYKPDFLFEARCVFGTQDDNHPAVKPLVQMNTSDNSEGSLKTNWHYVGGRVTKLKEREYFDFKEYRLTPQEVKDYISANGWEQVIGFQTRNPMHRSHVELTKYALNQVGDKAKLLLHPVVGMTQECDVDYHIRAKCYTKILKYYEPDQVKLCFLPLAMRMGGPREALWHTLIRRNYGCTHFVVGRDHAGPSYKTKEGESFYGPYDAHNLLNSLQNELENEYNIKVIKSTHICYVKSLDTYLPISDIPDEHKDSILNLSGTEQRRMLTSGENIPDWFTYPEIVEELKKFYRPNNEKGFCVYFTGLSGSGKSTLAKALATKLREIESKRKITVLDGDVVRHNLSKGLGFSREDRSINVRRIGYVASEIVKHGGICIVANIAPYHEDRVYNREQITRTGGFYYEIFVDTPIEVCEQRDTKGLYKKARQGIIKEFTGISDPYEKPTENECELIITYDSNKSVSDSVDDVMSYCNLSIH